MVAIDEPSVPPLHNGWGHQDENPRCLGQETVVRALEELKRGRAVVVTDDADRENEGDLIFAAELATPETMAFVVRHTSGVVCVALRGDRLDELALPAMVSRNEDPKGTAFAVSVDLRGHGVTTGISASDRAKTIKALADPRFSAADFCRPGHLFPLRARPGGVLERGGHTEAAVDLAVLAGLYPAGALCEIVRDEDGEMSRGEDLERFAKDHGLVVTTIEDIRAYRRQLETNSSDPPVHVARTTKRIRLPTKHGEFDAICFIEAGTGLEHVALVRGETLPMDDDDDDDDGLAAVRTPPSDDDEEQPRPVSPDSSPERRVPLVRVHSECATGDIFGSRRCDCGEQLERAMIDIAAQPSGILLYIRGHEGRGIGLGAKLEAYALQDRGRDTVDANIDLGFPVDARSYDAAAAILVRLGITEVRLMTNNPAKCDALRAGGIAIRERIPIITAPNKDNYNYLLTKQRKMGHVLNLKDE
ncbi:hypothetical protein CTAYLR_002072 [Chrysophaeum taylorii]|uniref:GTP cyclohydrolase II domain-containing protein n=1 Tax=Chrysophaeum taylorii TaxID=2483200 RepID=A0AAD7UP51_9STRA|nr:hypothetical protein CTAYLR_002072 [Chrysophaeum taylorii]